MSENNKIAKNTLFLYIRMFISMGVSLYTSRVILLVLGIDNFGIYSVVGGVVVLFSFFNGAMATSTQRFLSFDIGKNDDDQLKKTFNATINIHFVIAILALLLSETLGLWFINNKLNIPINRMFAANLVYQFSVFTFILGVLQVPYDALIIAREKMNVYAIMSVIEVFLKLIILFVIKLFHYDYLILYAAFLFFISFIVRMGHKYYCKVNFTESKYKFYYNKIYYKKLISYSFWNLFGSIAAIAKGQGINIVLNIFFGSIINAAYGISMQVQGTVNLFINNFQLAVNPQIIKSYAQGNISRCHDLILQSSKFSYYLMLIIILPFLLNVDFILRFWLKTPPKYTESFVFLCLINLLIDSISGPLMIGLQATGKIKLYQVIVGVLLILNLPLSYFFLKYTRTPQYVFYISIIISIVALFLRMYFVKLNLKLSLILFFKKVISPIFIVTSIDLLLFYFFEKKNIIMSDWLKLVFSSLLIIVVTIISILTVGINKDEKKYITKIIQNKFFNSLNEK